MSNGTHPFMPNSPPALKSELLAELGLTDAEPLFAQIPEAHRFRGDLGQPPALADEVSLRRHLRSLIARNRSAEDTLCFLGGGIWPHHVPAVVDEIVGRSEFLTPVWGTPSSDFGRNQAWFEFTSQLGSLLEMPLVGLPVYSWGAALGHAARMAARITRRQTLLVPASLCPERRLVLEGYAASADPAAAITLIDMPMAEGRIDIAALPALLGQHVAAVYIENPNWLGRFEPDAAAIAAQARNAGAQTIIGVDPASLGITASPAALGADIAVGSIQPLGIHMNAGGGLGGFIASTDDTAHAAEYPTLLNSIAETVDGQMSFGMMRFHQSSYGSREDGKDWTGNSTYLWAVAAAAYMALLGPQGFHDLGSAIIGKAHAAARTLAAVPGVKLRWADGFFKEFVLEYPGRPVAEVNAALLDHGVFGGLEIEPHAALWCVTELHSADDIAAAAAALAEVLA